MSEQKQSVRSDVFLDRIKCRLRPGEWYYHFLCALRDNDYEEEVKLLEPDFLENPSKYQTKNQLGKKQIAYVKPTASTSSEHHMDVDSDADNNGTATFTKGVFTCAPERNTPTGTIHLAVPWKEILGHSKPFIQATSGKKLESVEVVNQPQTSTNTQSTTLERAIIDETISKATDGQLNDISPTLLIQQTPEDTEAYSNEVALETQETETATNTGITVSPYKLRDYQVELSENAVNGLNTIICAETGTGKTYVALNIIEQHLADTSKGKHRVVFMARTNVLIQQQFQTLAKMLPMCKIKLISSEMDAITNMAAFLPTNDIFCLTPQILLNNIDKGSVQLSEFSLLILDECHHTSGNLPYSNLGRRYIIEKNNNVNNLPQIVGLTASIGIGKARTESEAVDYILKLCALLDCRILSTVQKYEDEYIKWCNIPTEERISLVEDHIDPCREAVSQAILKTEYILEDIAMLQPDLVDLVTNNRPHHAKKPAEYIKWALQLQKHAKQNHSSEDDLRDVGSCARYLIIFFSAFEVNKLLQIQNVMKYLAEALKVESQGKDRLTETENDLFNIFKEVQRSLIQIKRRDEDNPNVRTVCAQLGQMLNEKGEDSRAMVFVQARATCKALVEVLDLEFKTVRIKAHYLFGQDTRGCIPGMSKEEQTNTLEKFKEGHYKILVCTSVGIEGLDVPDCNIVINYNYAGNEITKVQMRGRSRKSDATHITIASSKLLERDEVNIYKVNIMYRAMKQIFKMDPTTFRRNIQDNQRHELKYHDPQHDEPKKRKITSDDDFTLSCQRCNAVVCHASDIHKLENNQHFVVDQSFAGRVNLVEHTAQQRYAGLLKRYKMFCKSCPHYWGIGAERDQYLLYIVKLENLKFKNDRTEVISFYTKWGEVPFEFPMHDLNDIPSLLSYQINTE